MTEELPELTDADFERSIPAHVRRRIADGQIESGDDVVAIRQFVGLAPEEFSRAFGITLDTLRGWESGQCLPEGPALSLLRVAARHPRVVRENVSSAA